MKEFFGDLFDLNGDGELDAMERAVDFGMFSEMMEEDEENNSDNDWEDDDF